ncbi:MAG: hypothetical protein J0H40_17295 [Rhizobiales bacterium]|nr:hypothetical protein [Hyphomicrobiales bacterium]
MKTLAPCVVCDRELDDESAGNNQPVGGLAFQCGGHWPSSVFDRGDGTWLEINVCEPCLRTATAQRRVLHGDREHRRARATYKIWDWPATRTPDSLVEQALAILDMSPDVLPESGDEIVGDVWILQRDADESDEDYVERAAMLGCDAEGRLRLQRS